MTDSPPAIGIIGGSGIYDLPGLAKARQKKVKSPWGEPSAPLRTGEIAGTEVVFLSRHDQGHRLSPSDINYRANIDVLKRAGWYLFKACYLSVATLVRYGLTLSERPMTETELRESSALYGCRPVNEIHDQFLIEAPEERGSAAAGATGLLMDRAGAEILRDVPVRCSPLLARRWSKRAEELRVGGELVAWEDPRFLRAVDGSAA